eukprot:CAMPEP_0179044886 /NCGR_PEP_ID=MMETSP0796-20121207/17898_1 /TAXON_ID=73915 /ORGANISM="Pyrodinium bahamense, Strain pbaha01" /LENGTH=631 /DNA_ID=CAMNT_0020741285 /DNA_START=48 /DNA_END=1943 /DNA_ORIENTATION=+
MGPPRPLPRLALVALAIGTRATHGATATTCPGSLELPGYGRPVSVVNAKLNVPGQPGGTVKVVGNSVVPHLTGRAYFAESCTEGQYDHTEYLALNLLGKTLRYTTDMTGAGCGCNAALYLVSMQQNTQISGCQDFYCDANSVCGVPCSEIDIQEANTLAWHTTVHSSTDHSGTGGGYGGNSLEFNAQQYGPGASCIDTGKPFQVAVSFPTNADGSLKAMEVLLSQEGHSCPVTVTISNYGGMAELSHALEAGMTPVISYWSSDDMLWMDGRGPSGQGPCLSDNAGACSGSVKFSDFTLSKIGEPAPAPAPLAPASAPASAPVPAPLPAVAQVPTAVQRTPMALPAFHKGPMHVASGVSAAGGLRGKCTAKGDSCSKTKCCQEEGMQCYEKNAWWAGCKKSCTPGIDPEEAKKYRTPWTCKALGPRTQATPASAPARSPSPSGSSSEGEEEEEQWEEVVVRILASDLPSGLAEGTALTLRTSSASFHGEYAGTSGMSSGSGVASAAAVVAAVFVTFGLTALAAVAGAVLLARAQWRAGWQAGWQASNEAVRSQVAQLSQARENAAKGKAQTSASTWSFMNLVAPQAVAPAPEPPNMFLAMSPDRNAAPSPARPLIPTCGFDNCEDPDEQKVK